MKNMELLKTKLSSIAVELQRAAGKTNTAASPLGIWMLLASIITSSQKMQAGAKNAAAVYKTLGMDYNQAASLLKKLLKAEGINYVSKGWANPEHKGVFKELDNWVKDSTIIPVESVLPTQDELNEWANTHSHGLIPEFPLEVKKETALILANLIYSKFSWLEPFQVVPATEDEKQALNVEDVLYTDARFNSAVIVNHKGNEFLAYTVAADDNSTVTLYMPGSKEVSDDALMEVMYANDAVVSDIDTLNGTPYGNTTLNSEGDAVNLRTFAWEAETKYDLAVLSDGKILETLKEMMTSPDDLDMMEVEGSHKAVAKFTSEGFEAAALTAFGLMRASAMMPRGKKHNISFMSLFGFISHTVDGIPAFSGIVSTATQPE